MKILSLKHKTALLITLSGIDGAGKSTLASHIRTFLFENYGITSRSIWCKYGVHPFTQLRLSRFLNRKESSKNNMDGAGINTGAIPITRKLYGKILLLFHLAHIIFDIRNSLQRGQSVICDRYIFDTIVDLQQELRYSALQAQETFNAGWIPTADSKFLLDLPEEIAFKRKPDSASIEFLRERRALYFDVAQKYKLTVLDATQPLENIIQATTTQIMEDNLLKQKRAG